MAYLSTRVYKGVKRYWRRRGYQRLAATTTLQHGIKNSDDSRSKRGRRSWRIRITPKLKMLRRCNPKKLLIGLHEAYVRMMMRVANAPMVYRGAIAGGYGGGGISQFGMRPKEYDEKMIIELYNSLAKWQKLAQLEAEAPQISCTSR